MGLHIEIEFDTHIEAIRRQVKRQRQPSHPEQGVQMLEHLGLETPGQTLPGQCLQLTQGAQPHARQRRGDVGLQADAVDGHLPEVMLQGLIVRHHQAVIGVGQHSCRHRVGRSNDAMAKTQFAEFATQARLELWPIAEQAEAGLDFEHQRPWVMHADLSAEPIGPSGQKLLPVFDLSGVVLGGGKAFAQGLRGAHGLAGA
ncbi:hypothetical protein D3C85_1225500 [compost metagenome]